MARVNLSNDAEEDSDDEEEDEDEEDGHNTSSQGSGQNSGENRTHPDGSIFVPDLGNGGSDADIIRSSDSVSQKPDEILDVE